MGNNRSKASATTVAASDIAAERVGLTEGMSLRGSEVESGLKRLRRNDAVRTDGDLFDFGLSLAKLGLTMTFQQRAALIGFDRVVELCLAIFELLDELFKLDQRVLKAQRGNIRRKRGGRLGHAQNIGGACDYRKPFPYANTPISAPPEHRHQLNTVRFSRREKSP